MNWPIKAKVGELDVLSSGTVIGFKDKPLEITIDAGPDSLTFELIFKFVANEQRSTNMSVAGPKRAKIELTNWENAIGTGITEPYHVGNFNGRNLYISFVHFVVGETKVIQLLHFTFYLGEKL